MVEEGGVKEAAAVVVTEVAITKWWVMGMGMMEMLMSDMVGDVCVGGVSEKRGRRERRRCCIQQETTAQHRQHKYTY